jgi:copper chaperone CopZ
VVHLKVEGMPCGACAISVKTALTRLDGVQEATVSFEKKEAEVRYVEGKVTVEQMIEAVNKLGYIASRPS